MAGTLILEAIVVLLALPVVARIGSGLTAVSGGYLIGLAVVLVLLAGIQGRSWAIWANLGAPGRADRRLWSCTARSASSVWCSPACGC